MSRITLFTGMLVGIFLPVSVFAAENQTVLSTVTAISPCSDASGYAILLGSTTPPLVVFKNGLSTSFPPGFMPKTGQNIFGILGTTTACGTVSGRILAFFSSGTPVLGTPVPPTQPVTVSNNNPIGNALNSSFSSVFSTLLQQIQHYFTPQSTTQNMQTAPRASAGGSGVGFTAALQCPGTLPPLGAPFGGLILTPPVPCTNFPSAYMITLGPPNPGPYMYIPLVTRTCRYAPPAVPGQWVTGFAVPGVCVVGLAPIKVMMMNIEGASLPGVSVPSIGGGAKPTTPKASTGGKGVANIDSVTTYTPFKCNSIQDQVSGTAAQRMEGCQFASGGGVIHTVQDYKDCLANPGGTTGVGASCSSIQGVTVAIPQGSGISHSDNFTWPELAKYYDLPANTVFIPADNYGVGRGYTSRGTYSVDLATCGSWNIGCNLPGRSNSETFTTRPTPIPGGH